MFNVYFLCMSGSYVHIVRIQLESQSLKSGLIRQCLLGTLGGALSVE